MQQLKIDFEAQPSEIKEYKVGELSTEIKKIIESKFPYIKLRGEVSGFKLASTGHGYFNIKDNNAILACTCWRPAMAKLAFNLEDGVEVVVFGKLTTYAGMSRYQLTVESILPSGDGALMALLKERRERLEKEGLFDASHKKSLPYLPRVIGVITSMTGVVIKDIIHRIKDRFPSRVIIWPVAVQGLNSSKELVNAISGFDKSPLNIRPDVIIVARGGGSVEDLWSFNEEEVVRAVFNCSIPIISAVGHETDFTLIDFVSDVRAPTPTAAGEFVVPVKSDIVAKIVNNFSNIVSNITKNINHTAILLKLKTQTLSNPWQILDNHSQRLDEICFNFNSAAENNLKNKESKIKMIVFNISILENFIKLKAMQMTFLYQTFQSRIFEKFRILDDKLALNRQILSSNSIDSTLKRGFAIVFKSGSVITRIEDLVEGDDVVVKLHEGSIETKVLKKL
jgi:exodeoxyribonuclease VII large subunit